MKRIFLLIIVSVTMLSAISYDGAIANPKHLSENNLNVLKEKNQAAVPFIIANIIIPQGEKLASFDLQFDRELTKQSAEFEIINGFKPISSDNIPIAIDESKILPVFPEQDYEVLGTQRYFGYDILMINLYPYKYNHLKKEVSYYSHYSINVEFVKDENRATEQNLMLQKSNKIYDDLANIVINPEEFYSYQKSYVASTRNLPDPNSPFSYLIITGESKMDYFQEFIQRKNEMGNTVGIFSTESIYENYEGLDNSDKIRNFIIDAYQVYGTTETELEYVLLGGDDEIIPIRGVYGEVGSTVDFHMPCDLYYSCLDGNWDANNNEVYGESSDNVDMLPEIAVGRIPAESNEQFQNFFNKTEYYEEVESYSNDVAYMYGENLNWDPVTWGGDYQDEIIPYIPAEFHINTLYEREGTFDVPAVINSINSGLGMISHMGHANYNYLFGFNTSALNQMENTEFGFAYTQGCYPAAFDDAACNGGECIAEEIVTRDIGLFAFVGNTRYGWYSPGNTNGASQAYNHTFFQGLFEENIRELGNVLNWSKTQLVNQALDSNVMRWVYYEMVLFGDPSTLVKDANGSYPYLEPVSYSFTEEIGDNDGNINPGETINLEVEVRNQFGWENAENAYIKFSIADQSISVLTDSVNIGVIISGETATNDIPLSFSLDNEQPLDVYNFDIELGATTFDDKIFRKTYHSTFAVNLDQLNWPWQSNMNINGSPVVVDFDNNGTKEVLINDVSGSVYFINDQAQTCIDSIFQDENVRKSIAYADINNDGLLDIITNSLNGSITAFDNSGEIIFSFEGYPNQSVTPVVSDINNDGNKEIISIGFDKNLVVLDNEGNLFPNFPVELENIVIAELAVGDINNNGNNEIVLLSSNGVLNVITSAGEQLDNFPIEVGSSIISPIILDNKKIVVANSDNQIKIINYAAEIIQEIQLEASIKDSPVAADLDDDNELEIIFNGSDGNIYAINQDGTILENFPVIIDGNFVTPPLVVDIDGDNNLDIISMTYMGDIYLVHADGSEFDLNPISTNHLDITPNTIADLDNDGDFDIVTGYGTGVTIVDFKSAKGTMTPWSIYRGNLARTGCYIDNLISGNSYETDSTPLILSLKNYPNPFNPSTTIAFNVTKKSAVKMGIYNIKGQLIANLVDDEMESGYHSVIWNGTDNSNKAVGSGVYFIKIDSDSEKSTRKILLLK